MESEHPETRHLRRGWTTGACATAATKAALTRLWGGDFPDEVSITLPRGETPCFEIAHTRAGEGWAEAGILKDAGDDPDVTHGALVIARVAPSAGGILFKAGDGVGTITKPGLPLEVGSAAINPAPRQMMREIVEQMATQFAAVGDIEITIAVPGGEEIAQKTWNPRLGIKGGLSILGTTGVVRPFSCAAWIASIHRGIDVARADGLTHVAGCTGATSEQYVQSLYHLADHAMLDMGDFAGGMLKYLSRHPVARLSVGGGIGKMTKLAQGARDLHSRRSQVDFGALASWADDEAISKANSALHALSLAGDASRAALLRSIAYNARATISGCLASAGPKAVDVVVIDRSGGELVRLETSPGNEALWLDGVRCS